MRKSPAPDFFKESQRPRKRRRSKKIDLGKINFGSLGHKIGQLFKRTLQRIVRFVSNHKKASAIGGGALVLALVVLLIVLSTGAPANPLIGKWSRTATGATTTLDFRSDGSLIALVTLDEDKGMTSLSSTYTQDHEHSTVTVTFNGQDKTYTYKIEENTLTIKNTESTVDGTILPTDDSELVYTKQ